MKLLLTSLKVGKLHNAFLSPWTVSKVMAHISKEWVNKGQREGLFPNSTNRPEIVTGSLKCVIIMF